jgi:hypothetical protein
MREDTLELGSPQVVDDVVLRPIARRRIARFDDGDVEGVLARLTPVGVLLEDDGTSRALGLGGEELPDDVLAELREDES